MSRTYSIMIVLVLLAMAAFIPGCYTIVGYPPEMMESTPEGDEALKDQSYGYSEYYQYDYPRSSYYGGYYDPYYGFIYPYNNYYWDYPYQYRDDYYRYYWDYDYEYVPNKKPESRFRGSTELRPKTEEKREGNLEKKDKPNREVRSTQGTGRAVQSSVKKHGESSSSSRSPKREAQDEEDER